MFEKVAEFYAREKYSPGTDSFIVAAAEDAFEDGANFGYKWANEWHHPSKGEYPTHSNRVLVFTDEGVGFGIYGLDYKGNKKWYTYDTDFDVIAWKEIVPPKEVKENEN